MNRIASWRTIDRSKSIYTLLICYNTTQFKKQSFLKNNFKYFESLKFVILTLLIYNYKQSYKHDYKLTIKLHFKVNITNFKDSKYYKVIFWKTLFGKQLT